MRDSVAFQPIRNTACTSKYVLDLDVRFVRRFAYAQRRAYTHCRRLCADYASIIAPGYAPIYKRHEQLTVDPLLLFIKPSTIKRKNSGRQALVAARCHRCRSGSEWYDFITSTRGFLLSLSLSFFRRAFATWKRTRKIFFLFSPFFFFCKRDLTIWRIFCNDKLKLFLCGFGALFSFFDFSDFEFKSGLYFFIFTLNLYTFYRLNRSIEKYLYQFLVITYVIYFIFFFYFFLVFPEFNQW